MSDGARPAVKFSWKLGEDQYSGLVTDPGQIKEETKQIKEETKQ